MILFVSQYLNNKCLYESILFMVSIQYLCDTYADYIMNFQYKIKDGAIVLNVATVMTNKHSVISSRFHILIKSRHNI